MASIRMISMPSQQRSYSLGQEVHDRNVHGIITNIRKDQFESVENSRPVYKVYLTDEDGTEYLYGKIDGIPCEIIYNKPEDKK